jgi:hypothetical protein
MNMVVYGLGLPSSDDDTMGVYHHFKFDASVDTDRDGDIVRLDHTIQNKFSVLTNFTMEMARERIVPFDKLTKSVQTIVKWLLSIYHPEYMTYSYLEFTPEEVKNLFTMYKVKK